MDEIQSWIDVLKGSPILAQIAGLLTAIGAIEAVLRRLPSTRPLIVYLAKIFEGIEGVAFLCKNACFWLSDKIGKVVPEVRKRITEKDEEKVVQATIEAQKTLDTQIEKAGTLIEKKENQ